MELDLDQAIQSVLSMRVLHELIDHRHGRNAETRELTHNAPADVMGYLPIFKEQTVFPKINGRQKNNHLIVNRVA